MVVEDFPSFSKSFMPSSIPLAGTSTLEFMITNGSESAIESLAFVDTLPTGMVIATPALAFTDCGTLATLLATPGTSVIILSAPGFSKIPALLGFATCTVTVDVTTDTAGLFVNTSGPLLESLPVDEEEEEGPVPLSGFATAALDVPAKFLVKSFIDDPVPPGGTVTLEFTLTNVTRDEVTGISFTDDLEDLFEGLAPSGPLPDDPCGMDSFLDFGFGVLSLDDGELLVDGSCTFSVTLDVPEMAETGTFTNTTSSVEATVDEESDTFDPATDDLVVDTVPVLTKEFIGDPVGAGATVTLEFTIINTNPDSSLTEISFTDDLTAALPGLFAPDLEGPSTKTDVCDGELTALDPEGTILSFTGGALALAGMEDDSCTFSVTLLVPVGADDGPHLNRTSDITATVFLEGMGEETIFPAGMGEETITGIPARDELLVVGGPTLLKEFTDDPVDPGGTVTLEFTLSLDDTALVSASDITFTDDLGGAQRPHRHRPAADGGMRPGRAGGRSRHRHPNRHEHAFFFGGQSRSRRNLHLQRHSRRAGPGPDGESYQHHVHCWSLRGTAASTSTTYGECRSHISLL